MTESDIDALYQLATFHDVAGEDLKTHAPVIPFTAASVAKIAHMQMRSYLIDLDPAASDGHEDTLFDLLDTDTLRWLVSLAHKQIFLEESPLPLDR